MALELIFKWCGMNQLRIVFKILIMDILWNFLSHYLSGSRYGCHTGSGANAAVIERLKH